MTGRVPEPNRRNAMKLVFVAAAAAALLPAAAQAQETRVEERRVVVMGGPGGHMQIGDEGLTREAFLAHHQDMFARLDADSNGVVTREEMAAMHAGMGHGPGMEGRSPGTMVFRGDDGEVIELDGNGEWSSEDGSRRIVVRRRGPGDGPLVIDGETIDIEGGDGGERRIVIRRRGPDGETVDVHDGHGPHGAPGEAGERHVMVFRHSAEGGLDADGDGRWSFDEMAAPLREHFNQLDANGDGFVDAAERQH
jgi:hypothetical protein